MPRPSEPMARYRALEDDLRLVRTEKGLGSAEEVPILEHMARLWWELSDIEREILDQEGPTCDPVETSEHDDLGLVDTIDGRVHARNA